VPPGTAAPSSRPGTLRRNEAQIHLFEVSADRPEEYRQEEAGLLVRTVETGRRSSVAGANPSEEAGLPAAFDLAWLRSPTRPRHDARRGRVTAVDLFSGCGGLSLGVWEACRALGLELEVVLAADMDGSALDVLERNLPLRQRHSDRLEAVIDGAVSSTVTAAERRFVSGLGDVDILLAGPPCQGHSDLNNHTRRNDPRNALFLRAARFAELVRPRHVIIENVPGVVHDAGNVVSQTWSILQRLGYRVAGGVLKADQFGVPQRRRRFFTVASLDCEPRLDVLIPRYGTAPRSFLWACEDLLAQEPDPPFDSPATHSDENRRRIEFLFEHDLFDLPDAERPECHRDKRHSYRSVYGRMHPDVPAQTITAGFGSTGQGRFVHPLTPRTITPHEAARLQFFPDFFSFDGVGRSALQRMIGNAVPPKLAYVLALELLR
jgi:DNA (cytosine-5)-methyltransferase 1